MNLYKKFKEEKQEEYNKIPYIFAFSNEQLEEVLKKRGLTIQDSKRLLFLGNGTFILNEDFKLIQEISEKHKNDLWNEIRKDTTGEKFIKDMFDYELRNHEYGFTMEYEDTIEALGFTIEDINNNANLLNGLRLAKNEILKEECEETEEIGV